MKKEFNLSEKRKNLNSIVWHKKTFPIDILREVKKQDKEFIKRLKEKTEDIYCSGNYCQSGSLMREIIDKIAGEELV